MFIQSLRLHDFRSYHQVLLTPPAGVTVFVGENGAGKTNLLEAVHLCCLGRSHRTAFDREMIRAGQETAAVQVRVQRADGVDEVGVRLYSPLQKKRKLLYINGKTAARTGELMGHVTCVMFSPEDLDIVRGAPQGRRRFVDMLLSQCGAGYYYALQTYNAALKQRNALLKDPDAAYAGMIEPWDEQLSRLGAAITVERAAFLQELSAIAADLHLQLSDHRETLLLAYQPNLPDADAEQLARAMRERLAENLERDLYRGFTSVGPHRDDVLMMLDGTDVRVYGSQGQQRTTVLSLKLSEIEIVKKLRGEAPVLLLDDVFSELDRRRQQMLLATVQGCQTFLTCTHLEELTAAGAERMQVYSVKDGRVIEV